MPDAAIFDEPSSLLELTEPQLPIFRLLSLDAGVARRGARRMRRSSVASLTRAAGRVRSVCTSNRQVLVAHKRGPELQGQAAVNWLRKQGRTPGCLIGDKLPQLPFWVEAEALDVLMRPPFFGSRVLDLDFEGEIVRALPGEVCCGEPRPVADACLAPPALRHPH
eukprot:scaffold2183_cov140-Isochrysis_galbana.AAC.7